jgi:hypothetical protein
VVTPTPWLHQGVQPYSVTCESRQGQTSLSCSMSVAHKVPGGASGGGGWRLGAGAYMTMGGVESCGQCECHLVLYLFREESVGKRVGCSSTISTTSTKKNL